MRTSRAEVVFFGKPYHWVKINGQLRLVPDLQLCTLMPRTAQRIRDHYSARILRDIQRKTIVRRDRKVSFTASYRGNVGQAEDAMRAFADSRSHFFREWREEVDALIRESSGVDLNEAGVEDQELRHLYLHNFNSQDSVSEILDKAYEIT